VTFPVPIPGMVIRYSYLWHDEHKMGQEEGLKDRPCAIVVAAKPEGGLSTVVVLPVTHTPPTSADSAFEIPAGVKRRLGLDDQRSWVMVNEANRFVWPGPDLRPAARGDADSVVFGHLPQKMFVEIRTKFVSALRKGAARAVSRTD
jgi:hypothetical protein